VKSRGRRGLRRTEKHRYKRISTARSTSLSPSLLRDGRWLVSRYPARKQRFRSPCGPWAVASFPVRKSGQNKESIDMGVIGSTTAAQAGKDRTAPRWTARTPRINDWRKRC